MTEVDILPMQDSASTGICPARRQGPPAGATGRLPGPSLPVLGHVSETGPSPFLPVAMPELPAEGAAFPSCRTG